MKIDGLTLRIRISEESNSAPDNETALLKWLLSEFQRENNLVDYHDNRATMQKGEPDDKDLRGQEA